MEKATVIILMPPLVSFNLLCSEPRDRIETVGREGIIRLNFP